jgi:hypothetical protein
MLRIHIHYRNEDEESTTTSRITRLPDSPFLILGTKPNERRIPLIDINWFWIEEE